MGKNDHHAGALSNECFLPEMIQQFECPKPSMTVNSSTMPALKLKLREKLPRKLGEVKGNTDTETIRYWDRFQFQSYDKLFSFVFLLCSLKLSSPMIFSKRKKKFVSHQVPRPLQDPGGALASSSTVDECNS